MEYVRFRHWTHLVDVCDGVRTVRMVRTRAIPRNVIIDGFPVKVSYVGQERECDICGKKGHIARSCDMRGKCMECKESGHFQRNCPVRRRRLANPDVDLPEVNESVDPVPGMPESASARAPTVPVVSAPAVDASSQAVSQSILADVSVAALNESVDARDNQLDELVSSGSIGAGTNFSDSLFGATVSTPNSNLPADAGDRPPNSNLSVNKLSDNASSESLINGNGDISNDIVNSELTKNGNNGISNDIVNSELNKNDDINVSDMQSNNDISSVDNDEVNDNVYETSSEGLLSDEDSSENDSDNEEESSDTETANVAPGANIVSPGSSLCGLSGSSGSRPPRSKLPVAVGKGSVGSKIPKVAGAGVQKASSSRPVLSRGALMTAQDWGVLSQRRR